jgi:pyruvate carboxylase subunit B
VHTIARFAEMAVELEGMGCDSLCIKDMAGLISPEAAAELVPSIKKRVKIPLDIHSHCTSGMAPLSYYAAAQAGVDIMDTAFSAFGWGTSQPPTESMVASLQNTPYDTGLNLSKLNDIGERFVEISQKYRMLFTAEVTRPSVAVLLHQIPGGMISNLVSQLRNQNALDRLPEVLAEVPRVRADLGYPPLVTPTSQVVGTQAVLNVLMGERYKQVTKETKSYLMGYYGAVAGEINAEVRQAIIGDEQPITVRPADLLPPELPKARSEAEKLGILHKEEDVVTYALYPEIAVKFLRGELKEEKLAPANPAPAASGATVAKAAGPKPTQKGAVLSPMNGMILSIRAKVGDKVKVGDVVATIEAMKMASEVCAPNSGTVTGIYTYEGELVNAKDVIMVIGDEQGKA